MASVGSSNITFASLRAAYNSGGEDDAIGDANIQSGSIKLADFRGAGFTDGSSVPLTGEISVNDDFAGKTFGARGLFQDIQSLAVTLNYLAQTEGVRPDRACSAIQSARSNFNPFAMVGYNNISENLYAQAHNYSQEGPPFITIPQFIYNSSNNYLGYGGTIESMSGLGSVQSALSSADGKKWMAMAMYTTDDVFRGILIWVFTGSLVNQAGSVVSGTMNVTTVRSIFNPDGVGNTFRQFYPIVIDNTGSIYNYSSSSSNGWNFSNGSLIGTNGYYSATAANAHGAGNRLGRFSIDDGSWGFKIGDQVDGNSPGVYLNSGTSSAPSYGIENPNGGDSQTRHYWDYKGGTINGSNGYYNGQNYFGIVFSADFTPGNP